MLESTEKLIANSKLLIEEKIKHEMPKIDNTNTLFKAKSSTYVSPEFELKFFINDRNQIIANVRTFNYEEEFMLNAIIDKKEIKSIRYIRKKGKYVIDSNSETLKLLTL